MLLSVLSVARARFTSARTAISRFRYAFTILEIAIEPRILEGHRCLRREHLQHGDPVRSEDARGQVVFEIENTREFRLVDQRQTENGTDATLKDVGIGGKRVLCREHHPE